MIFVLTLWEKLTTLLEDAQDSEEIPRVREGILKGEEETVSWEQAKAELRAEGVDV